jgi:hypothetical protein
MFSRSFAKSAKSPQAISDDIAARAYPTNRTIHRSPATSGEEHYTYKHEGFRVFENAAGNYAENLVKDYNQFMEGNGTLHYHNAITALYHTHIARSVEHIRTQRHIIEQLTSTPNTASPQQPASQPAPQPAPQPDYTLSRHLLDKMKYALPQHPKTLVVVRPDCCHADFDPANVPPERTFIKKCCEDPSSADTCCCHAGTSSKTVQFTNAIGECLYVSYFHRKNDFFNTTYRMWHNPSDDERVPHSPSDEVSESEIFPARYDCAFQNEIEEATTAAAEGFNHVWSNKSYKRRFERRQRRRQQLESGELPKYGLILVILDTEETRACRPHPIAGHDDERRQLYKARYEKIRDTVHKQAIAQGIITEPQPEPQQPQPKPKHRHVPDILHPFLLRRKLQHLQQPQSVLQIQRPLSSATIAVAHGVSRAQVTAISALHPHQRLRTVAGSLIALLAIRICCERTGIEAIVNQHINNYRDKHYVHNLHHDGLQHILRRASGSQNRATQIAAPYVEYATNHAQNIPDQLQVDLKQLMANRFKTPMAPYPQFMFGPHSFHKAEYYARECLKLIGTPETDPASAARWANLSAKVQSVRRGERTSYDVIAEPGADNDYWVYSIKHTFHQAIKSYLDANLEWLNMNDRSSRHDEGTATIRVDNGASLFWPQPQPQPHPHSNETQIRINASRVVQTTQMVHAMYRFIVRASCVISPEFIGVFGFNMRFIKSIISRAKHLATYDGDEASALVFGHFFPCLMTPDVHLDIFVGGNIFQHPELYVKMSNPVLGKLKKEFRDVIPSRHTGTIDRATFMQPPIIRCRGARA